MAKDYEEYSDFDEEPQARTEHEKISAFGYQHHGFFRAEIPIMPLTLAVFCCFLNMVVPGTGTFLSGISFLLFPLLIGFVWSVIWGIMFIQIARNWFISDLHHRTDFLTWCPCSNW
ncbi:Protein CBG07077 [Caenorhabditis briggsae]|uniref:Protein CBG07077 n=1 Tax=Caenorhabditis briggsae TaxID=6238 RepID=A8X3R5_CAEBR|nr:Protein CBG07077 [Caenorhabditis briggsae]CAP27275.2 Protein CBG07077 [Caenorhabditis briggsae]